MLACKSLCKILWDQTLLCVSVFWLLAHVGCFSVAFSSNYLNLILRVDGGYLLKVAHSISLILEWQFKDNFRHKSKLLKMLISIFLWGIPLNLEGFSSSSLTVCCLVYRFIEIEIIEIICKLWCWAIQLKI